MSTCLLRGHSSAHNRSKVTERDPRTEEMVMAEPSALAEMVRTQVGENQGGKVNTARRSAVAQGGTGLQGSWTLGREGNQSQRSGSEERRCLQTAGWRGVTGLNQSGRRERSDLLDSKGSCPWDRTEQCPGQPLGHSGSAAWTAPAEGGRGRR